jgi:hypothetical protein
MSGEKPIIHFQTPKRSPEKKMQSQNINSFLCYPCDRFASFAVNRFFWAFSYSYLNESAGFLSAALPIFEIIVRTVATIIIDADNIRIPGLI